MRDRIVELLEDVKQEGSRARREGGVVKVLVFRVLEVALELALDSGVL